MGTTHFSTMDFKSRFWQVKMVPESQQYAAFTMGNLGFYEFIHMPFWALQCSHSFQMPHAEHFGGIEPDILCHLPRQCHSIWTFGGGTPGASAHCA